MTTYKQALSIIKQFYPKKPSEWAKTQLNKIMDNADLNMRSDFTEVLPMFGLSEFTPTFYEIALKGVYELEQADMTFGEYVTIMDAVIKEIKDRQDMAREIIKSGEK